MASEALQRSLARVLDATVPPTVGPVTTEGPSKAAKKPIGPTGPPKGQEYELDFHFGNKSSLIRELWEDLDNYASSLGPDVGG